jgi:hypothetical protein
MVWKSWGAAPPPLRITLLLLAAAAPLCSGAGDVALSFSATPRRVSGSTSAAFAFRVMRAAGGPCADCLVTCQVPYQMHARHCCLPAFSTVQMSADHACGCCLLISCFVPPPSSWLLFPLLLLVLSMAC